MKSLFLLTSGTMGLIEYFSGGGISRTIRADVTALQIAFAYKFSNPDDLVSLDALHTKVAENILNLCQNNGGLYIKLGQGICAMNHILPPAYTEVLSVLQDRAPSVSFEEVEDVFMKEFGLHPNQIFAKFDPIPVASASIAQVHAAYLKDGTKVAVKVVKPNVRKQTPWDLGSYKFLLYFFEKLFDLPLSWSTEYILHHLKQELDFLNEARNSEKAAANFGNRSDIMIPSVYWNFSSKGILTTEWVDGYRFSDVEKIKSAGIDIAAVTRTMTEVFADQIFCHGFVHCDPHPGNLLVRRHEKTGKHQLCILDHGLYMQESEKFRKQYCDFWCSVFLRDYPRLQTVCLDWGIQDADFFASLQLFRPFSRKESKSPSGPVTKEDAISFQREVKNKVRKMLSATELIPKELLLLGRSMNLVRFNNKIVGSPINRLNIFALSAARGANTKTKFFGSAVFSLRLFATSCVHFVVQAWFKWGQLLGSSWIASGKSFEELLEIKEKQLMQEQFGFKIRHDQLG